MNRQPFSSAREVIVAEAIKEVVSELRMIDVSDYIAFMRLERFASVADLVETAAELYFHPGTLRLGHGGEARVSWSELPQIVLDLELRPQGANVYFNLILTDDHAAVQVNYVAFDEPSADPMANNAFLEAAIASCRLSKAAPAAAG